MITVRMKRDSAVPWWAALGAPLVGVPLMVALLALVAPEKEAHRAEPEAGFATEQVEPRTVDHAAERRVELMRQQPKSC